MDRLSIEDRAAGLHIMDLPDDVMARIIDKLDASSLSSTEWVCHRFRKIVTNYEMWKGLCMRACPPLARFCPDISTEHLMWEAERDPTRYAVRPSSRGKSPRGSPPSPAVLRSNAFYRLHAELAAPDAQYSLLAEALAASSTDNPEEKAANVLTPMHRFNPALGVRSGSYWSSKGSDDQGSTEWLLFRLAHPLCLVRSVAIRPFLAFFQRGYPIYSPQAVRFVFSCAELLQDGCREPVQAPLDPAPGAGAGGGTRLAAGAFPRAQGQPSVLVNGPHNGPPGFNPPPKCGGGGVPEEGTPDTDGFLAPGTCVRTRAFQVVVGPAPMQQLDRLQKFELEEPVLCVGGLLKVELIGRMQQQEQDAAWYTCINHVRVLGKPLYNFAPAWGAEAGHSSAADAGGKGALRLRMLRLDPLVAAGGLNAVSEGGLLEERLRLEQPGGQIVDSEDEDEGGMDLADANLLPLAGFGAAGFLAPPPLDP